MDLSKLESTLVGVAGEYLVAGELSLRGSLASITLRNSRGIDIIASTSDAARTITIQVKSNKNGAPSWILSKKSEEYFSDNHFYVFVALRPVGIRPDYYVVPSSVVAEYISTNHQKWLSGTKRDGSNRKDSSMRVFKDDAGNYKEAWELLNL
ncbi:aspartate ammonia-lyase [Vibrio cholerae]|nr:aspartate ammonia-lyase [Vibrio cholerae]